MAYHASCIYSHISRNCIVNALINVMKTGGD